MSNGTRLIAVVAVVVLAAIGLYYALIGYTPAEQTAADAPSSTPVAIDPAPTDGARTLTGSLSGTPDGGAATTAAGGSGAVIPPVPAGAFSPPHGAAASPPLSSITIQPAAGQPQPSQPELPKASVPSVASGGGSSIAQPPVMPVDKTADARMTEHVIQRGDTFEGLARRYFGDASKAKLIQAANPDVQANSMQIGQKIRIPAAVESLRPASGSAESAPAGARIAGGTAANTYTVLPKDTLMGISRKVYGSESDWRRILDANAALLHGDATALRPGMKLVIPAKS